MLHSLLADNEIQKPAANGHAPYYPACLLLYQMRRKVEYIGWPSAERLASNIKVRGSIPGCDVFHLFFDLRKNPQL